MLRWVNTMEDLAALLFVIFGSSLDDGCRVLDGLDMWRSAAWSSGNRDALAQLYIADSPEGIDDLASLDSFLERGIEVGAPRFERRECSEESASSMGTTVRVVERLAATEVVLPGGEVRLLPQDRWHDRALELRFHDERWKIANIESR